MRGFLPLLLLAACSGDDTKPDGGDTPTDGDADTDADADGDSDADTDADSDADADADTDADADADADADSDTDTDADADIGGEVDCLDVLPAPPPGELCAVSGDPLTATHILLQGDVLADDKSYLAGDVLAQRGVNGQIVCVGCDCAASAPPETLIVSCPDAVISPGLINSHDHIRYNLESPGSWGTERFDHRHDWRTGARGHTELDADSENTQEAVLYGELRMMLGGATSITGSIAGANGTGLMRNLDDADYNEGLGGWEVGYETFPLGDIDGTMSASGCEDYFIDPEYVLEDRIYLPHIAEGIDDEANNEFRCLSGLDAGGTDLVESNTSIVHGIGLDGSDVGVVADAGAKLIWSPRSNISLYGETASVVLYNNLGVTIALGTDWTPSGSATMLRELQCADYLNTNHYASHFSDRDLWLMVTRNAAVAMGADGQIGRLREGFIADIALFAKNGRTLHRAVIDAGISDVELVLRGSVPMTGDSDLVSSLLPASEFASCEALDDCVSDHVVCMDGGPTLAQVITAVGASAYDLTICAPPADEPTCVPLRDNEDGDGIIFPTSSLYDADEDGVDDPLDNCPDIFNPGMPLDGFLQGDVDLDGIGDACDLCPEDATQSCNYLDPDGDGVSGLDDNCPADSNPSQEDLDRDLLGDACDPCPDYRSATGACPGSVYDVKQGLYGDGDTIALQHMLVTAVSGSGVYLQLDSDDASYIGPEYSGIYAYFPSGDRPSRGDVITIEGAVNDFYGQIQLSDIASWSLEASGHPDPVPVLAQPADLANGGLLQWALESVVVTVEDVSVTAVDLPPGAGDDPPTNEFEIDSSLRVNDLLYSISPPPVLGESFSALSGVLRFANENSKLEPRDSLDVLAGDPSISAIVPDTALLPSGVTDDTLLVVRLARAAGQDETIDLDCSPATRLLCPATVTVFAGDQEAAIPLTGGVASLTPATVTATLGASDAQASVLVYDDSLARSVVSLDPDPLGISPNSVAPVTVTLDLPGETGGTTVDLVVDTALVSVPATVVVPEGALTASFDVTAGPTEGTDTITASIGTSFAETSVLIDPSAVGQGLLVSEYLEGTVGNNKFIEIKNMDPADINLSGCTVKIYSNGSSSAGSTIALDPVVLASGDLFLLCHSSTTFATYAPCDQTSGALTFNGDDAVELACGATVYDIIGQIGLDPGSSWGTPPLGTQDSVLRRDCSIAQGDAVGSDAFDPAAQWTAGPVDDASDLGHDLCP